MPAAALFGTIASLADSMVLFIAAAALTGVAVGHYFTPFQIKMGKVKPFTTLAWTVGFYNICWASGYAGGAFAGAFLQSLQPIWLISAAWALAVAGPTREPLLLATMTGCNIPAGTARKRGSFGSRGPLDPSVSAAQARRASGPAAMTNRAASKAGPRAATF